MFVFLYQCKNGTKAGYRIVNLWMLKNVRYEIAHLPVTLAKKPSLLVDSFALSFTNAALLRINVFFF